MTGRGGSSGISGNSCGPRPKSPKGSGDPIEILAFFYLADMQFFGTDTPFFGITHTTCVHARTEKAEQQFYLANTQFFGRNSSFTWRLRYFCRKLSFL